jgi:hypothetical protein
MKRLGLAALAACICTPVLAQTVAPPVTVVPLDGIWATALPFLQAILGVVVTAFIGWAAAKFTSKTHVDIEAAYRDSLHSAAMTGVNLALAKIGGIVGSMTIPAKDAVIAEAAGWVIKSVPDALKYLQITPDSVERLIESKLNALLSAGSTTATVQAAPSAGGSA